MPLAHSFEAYVDDDSLIVEHVPGLWESDNTLSPDVFVWRRGELLEFMQYGKRRIANFYKPGISTRLPVEPVPVEEQKLKEWARRIVKRLMEIRETYLINSPFRSTCISSPMTTRVCTF